MSTNWKEVFTSTMDGLTVVVHKANAAYTVTFGVTKQDQGGSFFSSHLPAGSFNPHMLVDLAEAAHEFVSQDKLTDASEEVARRLALSAKPGSTINIGGAPKVKSPSPAGPVVARDKNVSRSTGKTAKKKAKIEAARAAAAQRA